MLTAKKEYVFGIEIFNLSNSFAKFAIVGYNGGRIVCRDLVRGDSPLLMLGEVSPTVNDCLHLTTLGMVASCGSDVIVCI
jgi:hypothetical protein